MRDVKRKLLRGKSGAEKEHLSAMIEAMLRTQFPAPNMPLSSNYLEARIRSRDGGD